MNDEDFESWIFDASRDPYRTVLFDMHHQGGIVRLSHLPYRDESGNYYNDWVVKGSDPELEDELNAFTGIGDVDAVQPLGTGTDWRDLNFRGYPSEWYWGDIAWPKTQFRQIASTLIDSCRRLDGNEFRFDVLDGAQHLRRPVNTNETTNRDFSSAKSTIHRMLTWAGLPNAEYINVDQTNRDFRVGVTLNRDVIMSEMIRKITDSIGAYPRVNLQGNVECFIPDTTGTPPVILTDADIGHPSELNLVETIPAYKYVQMNLGFNPFINGNTTPEDPRTELTGATTGQLEETRVVDTLLWRSSDVNIRIQDLKDYYKVKHDVYQVPVLRANLLQKGDFIGLDLTELTGEGIISRIRKLPMSSFSLVEVTL